MTVFRADDRPRRREDIEERSAAEELVLYDPRRGKLHVLNLAAATIWRMCDGKTRASAMVAHLESGFRSPEGADIERDLASVLELLSREQLLMTEGLTSSPSNQPTVRGAQ